MSIRVAIALPHARRRSHYERVVGTDTCQIIWIASRLVTCGLGARYSTRRKIVLRLGERDVKGGEDDWEGEGELETVYPNQCSRCGAFTPLGRVLFILSSLVSMWQSCPQMPSHNEYSTSSMYTLTTVRRLTDGIIVHVGVPSIRTLHHDYIFESTGAFNCQLRGLRTIHICAPTTVLSCGTRQKGKHMDLEHLMQT